MKAQDIKTQQEFYDFADIQYKRAHNLRRIWQESDEPFEKKMRAFWLWKIMVNRVLKLSQIAIEISKPKQPTKKHTAALFGENKSENETIVPRKN